MDTKDYKAWREDLACCLEANPDKMFSSRRRALAAELLGSHFPNTTILSYYAEPVVSSEEKIKSFKPEWKKPDVPVLAQLCKELFQWDTRWGMRRFIRSITPGLLIWDIVHKGPVYLTNPVLTNPVVRQLPITRPKSKSNVPTSSVEGKQLTDYFKSTKKQSTAVPEKSISETADEACPVLGIHGTRTHSSIDVKTGLD
jgi:hypothetical protein